MERIPASERTREHLKALMEGKSPASEASSELVRLAARLVIEEALEPKMLSSTWRRAAKEDTASCREFFQDNGPPGGHRPGCGDWPMPSKRARIERQNVGCAPCSALNWPQPPKPDSWKPRYCGCPRAGSGSLRA
jgi:hypothetical protein